MVGISSLVSRQPREPLRPGKYDPSTDEQFSLAKSTSHIVRKAGYKSLGNGQFVRTGWSNRTRTLLEGNNADARYHRAAYDSSQRLTAVMIAEKYRAGNVDLPDEEAPDLSDNSRVRSRFYRQDNLRFNPEFADPQNGLSRSDRAAVRLSRCAQWANGVTELGAAPTGLMLKVSRNLITPNRDDKAMGSQLRVFAALIAIVGAVSKASAGLKNLAEKAFQTVDESNKAGIVALVGSFSAVSAVSSLVSLALGASSSLMAARSQLSPAIMKLLQFNKDKHIHRLYALLSDAKDKQGAVTLIAKALEGKIAVNYRGADGTPHLLSRLLEDVRQNPGEKAAKVAMQKTIGSYLSERDTQGLSPENFLDQKADKAELLNRENHFVALTNLIEHTAIHSDPHDDFKDLRHGIETRVENLRKGVLNGSGNVLNVLGFTKSAERLKYLATQEFIEQRGKDKLNPALAPKMRYCADNILNNSHQYGPVTRRLATMSETLRVFNHAVLLSLNYQLTRPIAWLAGRVTEKAFSIPNSRVTSFSIGRFFSSAMWAVADAYVILSLAGGNGIAYQGADRPLRFTFPLDITLGAINVSVSIISTAAQMLVVAVPAAVLMAAAQGACYLEGWEGNVGRQPERPDSKRNPLAWA